MSKTIDQKLDDLEQYIDELEWGGLSIAEMTAKLELGVYKVQEINNVAKKMDEDQKIRMKFLANRLVSKAVRLI